MIAMADYYGDDQTVEDVDWLKEVAKKGWVALTHDYRIRRQSDELAVLVKHKVRLFVVKHYDREDAPQTAQRVLGQLDRILAVCQQPGPFIYRITKNSVTKRYPPETSA